MLFLAVFCGFLAEYQLEHTIEKSREKQYIRSFAEDLALDTFDLDGRIQHCQITVERADSLALLLKNKDNPANANNIYFFLRFLHRSNPFYVNDRTIVQLRNAGGMRLISNKSVSDSMLSYYKDVDFLRFLHEEQIEIKRSLRSQFGKIVDGFDFSKVIDDQNRLIRTTEPLKLRTVDDETVNTIIITLQNIKGINQGTKMRLHDLKEKAKIIRDYIKKQYGLKDVKSEK